MSTKIEEYFLNESILFLFIIWLAKYLSYIDYKF